MAATLRKKVARVALACLLALSCFSATSIVTLVSAHGERSAAYAADAWKKSGNRWWYQTGDSYAKGWKQISGKWYYFDSSGWMKTGWQKIGGAWYYFYPSGEMAKGGWHTINGKSYYLQDSGALKTGWNACGLFTYMYHNSAGVMATGWQKIGGKWYYFSSTGLMLTGWQYIAGKWYYLDSSSGAMVANKWIGNYYFKSDGSMATNQQIGKYYIGSNGRWTDAPNPTSAQKNAIVGEWHVGGRIIEGIMAAMPDIAPHSDFCFQAFSDGTYRVHRGEETGWRYGTWEFREIRDDQWDKSLQFYDYVLYENGKPYAEVTASSIPNHISLSPLGTVSSYTLYCV